MDNVNYWSLSKDILLLLYCMWTGQKMESVYQLIHKVINYSSLTSIQENKYFVHKLEIINGLLGPENLDSQFKVSFKVSISLI
jgi:hypothetical protein